jgi:hexokinase
MRRTSSEFNPTTARDRSPSQKAAHRDAVHPRPVLSPHHLLSGLVLVLVLVLQFLVAPHLPHEIVRHFTHTANPSHWHAQSPSDSLHTTPLSRSPPVCPKPKPKIDFAGTFHTDTVRSMALAEQAKRVAAEFEFGPDAVNKAVKEFIREMGRLRGSCRTGNWC